MTKLKRATYSAAIKLETAQLVVDQSYTQEEAAKASTSEIERHEGARSEDAEKSTSKTE